MSSSFGAKTPDIDKLLIVNPPKPKKMSLKAIAAELKRAAK